MDIDREIVIDRANDRMEELEKVTVIMLAALLNVQKIITEAAMTGFNCKDGDWAERLFESQQMTSAAIKKARELGKGGTLIALARISKHS